MCVYMYIHIHIHIHIYIYIGPPLAGLNDLLWQSKVDPSGHMSASTAKLPVFVLLFLLLLLLRSVPPQFSTGHFRLPSRRLPATARQQHGHEKYLQSGAKAVHTKRR